MPIGTVVRLFSDFAEVVLDHAAPAEPSLVTARFRGRLTRRRGEATSALAVGDRVELALSEAESVVESVLPRRSKISRRSPENPRLEQVVAANVDQVLVVASAQLPEFRAGLVDRYLVAAAAEGLAPGLCLTHCDLVPTERVDVLLTPYRSIGVPTFPVGRGDAVAIEHLRRTFLAGKATVLVGHSGVGKTTLRNALLGASAERATAPVSRRSGKGLHVTTAATFEGLLPAGYLVDTPGIREFGIWRLGPDDVASCFPEFADATCRFTNCRHATEPGCGLRQRVDTGAAAPARLASLVAISDSLREG